MRKSEDYVTHTMCHQMQRGLGQAVLGTCGWLSYLIVHVRSSGHGGQRWVAQRWVMVFTGYVEGQKSLSVLGS
jgi:hypothetical protein